MTIIKPMKEAENLARIWNNQLLLLQKFDWSKLLSNLQNSFGWNRGFVSQKEALMNFHQWKYPKHAGISSKHLRPCYFDFFSWFFMITSSMYSIPLPSYTSGGLQLRTEAANWCILSSSIPVQQTTLFLKQKYKQLEEQWVQPHDCIFKTHNLMKAKEFGFHYC